jgi:gas vesicle protein GvpL/GvpF
MAWYVFALVDAIPSGRPGTGLAGVLTIRKLAGAFAVVERRADVPPMEFGSLQKHQDVVARLASRVPAILPVRFGTLLESEDLDDAVRDRDDEIVEAFDAVRGRVQFTWRRAARGAKRAAAGASGEAEAARREVGGARRGAQPAIGEMRGEESVTTLAASGTEYLRGIARAAKPSPPAAYRALGAALGAFVVAQRYQAGTGIVPEAVYHLVERTHVNRYRTAARALAASSPPLVMTGPWAPFAFAPEIL